MTNKKLLMFAVAGLVAPAAFQGAAQAEVHNATVSVAIPAPVNDTAPVTGTPPRLKRTDQEQPGVEMPAFALFGDGKNGLYFAETTELNGVRAPNRVQLSVTKFALAQDPATGAVSAQFDTAGAKFTTSNDGNERRNANNATAAAVNGGSVICAKYNYNQNNDTVRYVQCFNQAGAVVLPQTKAYAKNNDDCSMHQDGEPGAIVSFDKASATTKMVEWAGCNGNGADDGWAFVTEIKCNSADAPTSCTFKNVFDVSMAPREERSRGRCTVDAADPSYAVCSWTEGNNQPQRDGVWLGAIALDKGVTGANKQETILWKKQIAGRKDVDGVRTYAQRAIQERVLKMNPTTNELEPTNQLMFRWGDATGGNANNGAKGGTYRTAMLSVIQVAKTGMTYVAEPADYQAALPGLGGTHLGTATAIFGTTASSMPGLMFLNGSHTGGGPSSQIRAVGLDPATNKFKDLGMQFVASHDRHLYPNYLGNNPGNQGRNHSQMAMVRNPYAGQAGNTDAYVLLTATAGKAMADVDKPAVKLTGFLSVSGIVQTPPPATVDPGPGTDPGTGPGTDPGADPGTGGASDPGTTLGGCNAGGASGGLATFLLIGLAAFIRRRR